MTALGSSKRILCRLLQAALAMVVLSFPLASRAAVEAGQYLEGVILFTFEIAGDEEEVDPYYSKISEVSMEVLFDELFMAPQVGWVDWLELQSDPESRHRIAKEEGARYFIEGRFEVIRKNVQITARWSDLESGASGVQRARLGLKDLEDFYLIETKTRGLARSLVEKMGRIGGPQGRKVSEAILVSCFTGGQVVGQPFLDSHLTLELPEYLGRMLEREGLSLDRIRVEKGCPLMSTPRSAKR
jgi:hypothetical protein